MKNYTPHPIDISDVSLDTDLNELKEAIAENAHEIWAANRQKEGWTYGPTRNDALKQTPDMVPYRDLTDTEKEYDRIMAMNTIKLLRKLGYELIKKNDTALFRELIAKIKSSEEIYHCNDCGNIILKHQVFCSHCGKKLEHMDFEE